MWFRKLLPINLGSRARWTLAHCGAKVSAITHQEKCCNGSKSIEQSKDSALSFGKGEGQLCQQVVPERHPECGRVHLVLGQLEPSGAHVLVGEELDLLETHDLRAHQHVAMRPSCRSENALLFGDFKDSHLRVPDSVREIIYVHPFHRCFPLIEIEALDVVLLSLMDVERLGMNSRKRGGEIHLTDRLRLAILFPSCVDNDEVFRGHCP